MNKSLVSVAIAGLVAAGGYATGHRQANQCSSGYTRGVVAVEPQQGPGSTLAPRAMMWQYVMQSGCFKRVTTPIVTLIGGPFDAQVYYANYYANPAPDYSVVKLDPSVPYGQGGLSQVSVNDGGVTIEQNGKQIAVRPRLGWDGSKPTYGPASHYRLSDGHFLSTDVA